MATPVPSEIDLSADLRVLKNLWPYIWPKSLPNIRWRFIIAVTCLIMAKLATIAVPFFFKEAIDQLSIPQTALMIPLGMIFAYGLARMLSAVLSEVRDGVFAGVMQRTVREIGLAVFHHLHALGLRFHLDRQTGGLSRSIERGTKGIENLLHFMTFNIIPTVIEIVLVCSVLWGVYDYRFAVLTFVTMISYVIFTLVVTEWRISYVRTMNAMDSEANTKAIDSLLNFETVKYFGNEQHEANRFDRALRKYERAAVRSKLTLAFLNIGQAVIIAIGLIIVMIMAAYQVRASYLTVGDFVAINTYLIQLYIPLFMLGFAYREVKLSLVNMESMFSLLQIPQEVKDIENAPDLSLKKAEIVFDNVSFYYAPDRPILRHVSFIVPSGKTVAIVGASGAGKSTIGRLLFRFYDVIEGRILIDGQDIRCITQTSLRRSIGIVPQDTVLFNDTIAYNIAYGNPMAIDAEIIEAARSAHIHDFIKSLPQGYQTTVGERGLKLSGGEKQRVAIARTLLKKPEIFLFDEATSALDTKTEKDIQESLREIAENHTTLIIAHRLSTIIDADEILVMDKGEIVERGKHKDLLKKKGLYATMWKRQQEQRPEEDQERELPSLKEEKQTNIEEESYEWRDIEYDHEKE